LEGTAVITKMMVTKRMSVMPSPLPAGDDRLQRNSRILP
jgi:hypothetical protein